MLLLDDHFSKWPSESRPADHGSLGPLLTAALATKAIAIIMRPPLELLIVSSDLEKRRNLLDIVQGLPIDVFTASTIQHAWEFLIAKSVDLIFCDECLIDGTYPEFLTAVRSEHKASRFVVLLGSDEWENYLQAIGLGAFEAIRWDYLPTDIELVLIRATRELPAETLRASA